MPIRYRVSRRMHDAVFADDAPLFPAGAAFYRTLERAPRPVRTFAHGLEHAAKPPMFGCRDCGDCSLPDVAFLCPESQCAKNQRNGPCGGTRDGRCEVDYGDCIWSRAYERLKHDGEEESMLDGPVVVKDNALARTSAWSNAFLRRDHNARQRGSTGEDQAPLTRIVQVTPFSSRLSQTDCEPRSGSAQDHCGAALEGSLGHDQKVAHRAKIPGMLFEVS